MFLLYMPVLDYIVLCFCITVVLWNLLGIFFLETLVICLDINFLYGLKVDFFNTTWKECIKVKACNLSKFHHVTQHQSNRTCVEYTIRTQDHNFNISMCLVHNTDSRPQFQYKFHIRLSLVTSIVTMFESLI